MKKSLNTYSKGDKVKVDRGSSGNGVQFLTIKDGFETDNINGYKDYNFEELEPEIKICEYYIRPIKESDLKLKKLCENTKAEEFEFDYDEVQKNFWKSQRDNIKNVTNYLNDFLTPYLLEYKHTLPVDEMVTWDSYYKRGMRTKNRYIFVIPHKIFNIIVFQGTTNITVFITAPSDKYELKEENKKSVLFVCEMFTKYSDEEYVNHMVELTKDIISKFEKCFEKGHYYINPDYKKIDAIERYMPFLVRGDYSDWQTPIPGNYTYALRDLNYLKHYYFNKGFN